MTDAIDLNRVRFEKATKAHQMTPLGTLREAIRQIEAGEWPINSVMIIGLIDDGEMTHVDMMHAGPATKLERLGMTVRAQHMMVDQ